MESNVFVLDLGLSFEKEFTNFGARGVRNSYQCACTNNCYGGNCDSSCKAPGPAG